MFRLSEYAKSYPESSNSASGVNFYHDPSNFLSCSSLDSPKEVIFDLHTNIFQNFTDKKTRTLSAKDKFQVWHRLCNSWEKDHERKSEKWEKLEVKSIRSRVTTTLLTMIQVIGFLPIANQSTKFHFSSASI